MTATHKRFRNRFAIAAAWATMFLLVGGLLLHWSWNTFAVDVLHAPVMEFRHALAAEILIGATALIGACSVRLACGGAHRRRPIA